MNAPFALESLEGAVKYGQMFRLEAAMDRLPLDFNVLNGVMLLDVGNDLLDFGR